MIGGDKCPWDNSSESEDEDWLYESVSRYQHLVMCRLGIISSSLAVSPSGRRLALSGQGKGDSQELGLYSFPPKLLANCHTVEGLTNNRDFGLIAGSIEVGPVNQMQFVDEDSLIVGTGREAGLALWTKETEAGGDLLQRRQLLGGTTIMPEAIHTTPSIVTIAGGHHVGRRELGGSGWQERDLRPLATVGSVVPTKTEVMAVASEGEVAWCALAEGLLHQVDWRLPTTNMYNLDEPSGCGWLASTFLTVQGNTHLACLERRGAVQMWDTRNLSSPSRGIKHPYNLGASSYLQLVGGTDSLLVINGDAVSVLSTSSSTLELAFIHDGHTKTNDSVKVLAACPHPSQDRLVISSDSRGNLHCWQWNLTQ